MTIIGLAGYKGSGKSTACNYLCQKYNATEESFAGPLKSILGTLFFLNKEELYGKDKEVLNEKLGVTPRKLMQVVGTDLFRDKLKEVIELQIDKHIWVWNMEQRLLEYSEKDLVIVSDVRFEDECDLIHKMGGRVIRIDRSTENLDNHPSETSIDKLMVDEIIPNNSSLENFYSLLNSYIISAVQKDLILV